MNDFKISYVLNGVPRSKVVECESIGEAWEVADNLSDSHDDCYIVSVVEVVKM